MNFLKKKKCNSFCGFILLSKRINYGLHIKNMENLRPLYEKAQKTERLQANIPYNIQSFL